MLPEAAEAWNFASRQFVRLDELHDAVGKQIAKLVHAEAAMVSSGAAGALVIGTAACITGNDLTKIQRIPDLAGMKNEVIIQKVHRYPHDHAVRVCGVTLVEVDSAEDLRRAVNSRTAMMLFVNEGRPIPPAKSAFRSSSGSAKNSTSPRLSTRLRIFLPLRIFGNSHRWASIW
jgi:L-seryl-tRNA(Ser) seleniumtransferase